MLVLHCEQKALSLGVFVRVSLPRISNPVSNLNSRAWFLSFRMWLLIPSS